MAKRKLTKKQDKLLTDWLTACPFPKSDLNDYNMGYFTAARVIRRILATDSPSELAAIRDEVL